MTLVAKRTRPDTAGTEQMQLMTPEKGTSISDPYRKNQRTSFPTVYPSKKLNSRRLHLEEKVDAKAYILEDLLNHIEEHFTTERNEEPSRTGRDAGLSA